MPHIQGHATARLFQSIYPHDPKIVAGNPAPSPSDDPHSPLRRSRPHRPLASVDGDRQTTTISAVPVQKTQEEQGSDTSGAFPPCTGPVIFHPGRNPDLSVPPYNLSDHILGPARRLDSHGPTLNQNVRIDQAIDELAKRFQPVWITQSPLSCRLSPKTEALIWMRFLDGAGRTKGALMVMIALNLHLSQQVLPVITNAILTSLQYLGANNVYVSGADSACGTDWWEAKTLREQQDAAPLAADPDGESKVFQARFHNVLPVPVYLCWNDIVALAPAPFRGPEGLTFRAADRLTNKCPSSECQLFAKDFSLGFNKCLLIPNVAVTYTRIIYYAGGVVRGSNCDNPLSRTR
ncbi:hypothetical protein PTTG_02026 [Puccinia triticina 1-1 BBBD Race 1]|uniref:Uncharacterized protein n=1 Tax=Puccinia triticina (isolate 1-1 / race 1 (BBBD)) TaxID=630390 RepID=A0A180G1S0_PUCT1|nr:hypothetical protein PTTG_02026 [Puccinia triticina 1-1 BBBD Race 1]